jgi:class 3 adenylate cyclase
MDMEPGDQEGTLAVVMLTRIDGFDRRLAENPVEAGKLLAFHDAYITDHVQQHNGQVLEIRQGTLLARFPGAKDAVTCGMAIQKAMKEHNRGVSAQNRFRLRIGIHAGDFVFGEKGISGPGFKIVVGLGEMASPGRIYLSADACEEASRDTGVHAVSRGELRIQGMDKPLSIFEMLSLGGRSAGMAEHEHPTDEPPRDTRERSSENADPEDQSEGWEASGWDAAAWKTSGGQAPGGQAPGRQAEDRRPASFFSQIDRAGGVQMMGFQDQHPDASRKLFSFLERLSRKGVLRKTLQQDGVVEYSLSSPRDLINIKRVFAKDRRSDPSLPAGGYRIKPSVFVGGIAVVVVLSIVFSVITGGAFFPLLILAGLFVWIRRNRIAASGDRSNLEEPIRSRFEGESPAETRPSDTAGAEAEIHKLAGYICQELSANSEISEEIRQSFFGHLVGYRDLVRALWERNVEISRILSVFPINSLDKDLKILQDKRQRTDDGSLKEEYGESIRQIEKQRAKYDHLQKQRESIQQRLRSALSSLKQIYLSVARMKGLSESFGFQPLEALKKESRKLGDFLDDLNRETTR